MSLNKTEVALKEPLIASVTINGFISTKPPIDNGGGEIDWGDKSPKTPIPMQGGSYTHVYSETGTHTIKAHAQRQFKWHANDGSCSFYCKTESQGVSVVVRQLVTAAEMVKYLQNSNSPEAKKLLDAHQAQHTEQTQTNK